MITRIFLALILSSPLMAQDSIHVARNTFLSLGDSYTIGESVEQNERWPNQLASALRNKGIAIDDPRIIATTGWRTDDLKKAIMAAGLKGPFSLVSLLIGVNNQYQGRSAESYSPEFEELLNIATSLAGGDRSRVFVVSIPDYGFTPFGKPKQETITRQIDEFNAVNRDITSRHGITYVDITPISRRGLAEPKLVAGDGLHPSGTMYKAWVDEILKTVDWKVLTSPK